MANHNGSLGARVFSDFRELVYKKSGIKLDDGKESLVRSRVGKRMHALRITDYEEYLKFLTQDESGKEMVHFLDAISTNVTSFFREPDHFQLLENILKKWSLSGQKRLRIWSAACSTGEEAYSIAITALEATPVRRDSQSTKGEHQDIRILATDISTRVLEKAQLGIYEAEKIERVPKNLRKVYFEQISAPDTALFRVKPILRDMIVFKRLNLSDPPFPMRGPMDVIFCRNVMIYFDRDTRQKLLEEIHRLLKTHGHLIVGHAESLAGLTNGFTAVRPSVYIKNE